MKCTRCIDYFREQKRRLELIHDLKAKNEGMSHASLKNQACGMIRKLGKENFPDWSTSVETEVPIEGVGKVDVVGQIGDVTIAVECGNTRANKIFELHKHFDVVLHIPYCYTWNFMDINIDEITHQLFTGMIAKELKRRGYAKGLERNKPICLEEGECSLPSGLKGFPDEAMQIAGLSKSNWEYRKREAKA